MIPKTGDRVRVTGVMPNDPDPIPVGTTGTVTGVGDRLFRDSPTQIFVDWDIKRSLILLDSDPFEVVEPGVQ